MIRTCCAACGKLLPHTAPRCGNCSTPYCDRDCQKLHWKAGHKKECKQIELGGGAEQYYADKKCAEAVAVAVETRTTQGQTCYICTEALHWKTKEGLVRMCAPRDGRVCPRVVPGGEPKYCSRRPWREIWMTRQQKHGRGGTLVTVRAKYHGVVRCALGGRAGRRMGRPQTDGFEGAMGQLGNGSSWQGTRTRCPCTRPCWLWSGGLVHQKPPLTFRAILRPRIQSWDGMKRHWTCVETFTLNLDSLWRRSR